MFNLLRFKWQFMDEFHKYWFFEEVQFCNIKLDKWIRNGCPPAEKGLVFSLVGSGSMMLDCQTLDSGFESSLWFHPWSLLCRNKIFNHTLPQDHVAFPVLQLLTKRGILSRPGRTNQYREVLQHVNLYPSGPQYLYYDPSRYWLFLLDTDWSLLFAGLPPIPTFPNFF